MFVDPTLSCLPASAFLKDREYSSRASNAELAATQLLPLFTVTATPETKGKESARYCIALFSVSGSSTVTRITRCPNELEYLDLVPDAIDLTLQPVFGEVVYMIHSFALVKLCTELVLVVLAKDLILLRDFLVTEDTKFSGRLHPNHVRILALSRMVGWWSSLCLP